ncbi:MAG: 1-deoxy-D-xylulose-5-phosphate reductoisomerase [Gammaproteobacteria bacterium]
MNKPLNITVLGSTGSIGVSTLNVIARHSDRFKVIALTACKAIDRLYQQCMEFQPKYAVMENADAAEQLQKRLNKGAPHIEVLAGADAIIQVAGLDEVDYVMAAIVGSAGLLPTLEAARKGKRILLANKEALVMSGELFMQEVHDNKAVLLPVDSEHNAIFQCLPSDFRPGHDMPDSVEQVLLTGSGGPFRDTPINMLEQVTPDQACAHPNWDMGRKISVDSATMMNKGLEVIEACWLFSLTIEQIQVVIHPQSVIHSLVQYQDGSVLAQLGKPDMRTPIAHALAWPQRIQSGVGHLDLVEIGRLDFEKPDYQRFPCLALAYQAWKTGGTASAVLNAANEVAVQAFLEGDLAFKSIATVIEKTLENTEIQPAVSVEAILDADNAARLHAQALLAVKQQRVMS